jgi:hypothetical protein
MHFYEYQATPMIQRQLYVYSFFFKKSYNDCDDVCDETVEHIQFFENYYEQYNISELFDPQIWNFDSEEGRNELAEEVENFFKKLIHIFSIGMMKMIDMDDELYFDKKKHDEEHFLSANDLHKIFSLVEKHEFLRSNLEIIELISVMRKKFDSDRMFFKYATSLLATCLVN